MWSPMNAWFDLAVIQAVFALGNLLFGRFEEHLPRWKRLLKWALGSAIYLALVQGAGRAWGALFLGVFGIVAAVVHGWWLPRHGVNGWTAEPYERYLKLVARRNAAPRRAASPSEP